MHKRFSVGDSVGDGIGGSVGDSVGALVEVSVGESVEDFAGYSVGNSVGDTVEGSLGDVWESVSGNCGHSAGILFTQIDVVTFPSSTFITTLWSPALSPSTAHACA